LNIYDTRTIYCIECSKPIGEIDFDAKVICPICGQCDDPKPDVKDRFPYRRKPHETNNIEKPIPARLN
jgi:hypothetical protein